LTSRPLSEEELERRAEKGRREYVLSPESCSISAGDLMAEERRRGSETEERGEVSRSTSSIVVVVVAMAVKAMKRLTGGGFVNLDVRGWEYVKS
jgi:hypothetical protein